MGNDPEEFIFLQQTATVRSNNLLMRNQQRNTSAEWAKKISPGCSLVSG
jgi:hypothetical protein